MSEARERWLSMIDEAMAKRPLDERIPEEIEAEAKQLFERETEGLTGHVWVWKDASVQVRHSYRTTVLLRRCGYPA